MRAARQQKGELSFVVIDGLPYPVALIAMALLPISILLAPDVGELAATCGLALVANAFICGTLSNPHDRYGLVWIAALAGVIAVLRFTSRLGSRGGIA